MTVRKVSAVVIVIVGLFWAISTFALDYPAKTQAMDDVTNSFRPVYSDAGIAQSTNDLQVAGAFATDFQTEAVPALVQQLNQRNGTTLTSAQFLASIGSNYPDVGAGLQTLPVALPYFQALLDEVKADRSNFEKTDNIPGLGLPTTSVHFVFLGNGIAAIVLGGLALRRGRLGTVGLALAGVLGIVAIAGTLALQEPGKTAGAERLQDHSRPMLTDDEAAKAQDYVATLRALDSQLRGETLPAVAQQLGVSPTILQLGLGTQLPSVATGVTQFPAILDRLTVLTDTLATSVKPFQESDHLPTKGVPITIIPWQLIGPGIVLVLAVGGALVAGRREEPLHRADGSAAPDGSAALDGSVERGTV